MFIDDKVTEIFCMTDDFCIFGGYMTENNTLCSTSKRKAGAT